MGGLTLLNRLASLGEWAKVYRDGKPDSLRARAQWNRERAGLLDARAHRTGKMKFTHRANRLEERARAFEARADKLEAK